jgi:hypothetical protein
MYNYSNNQKNNAAYLKKMAGPNADRVNPYMAPGAYQQTPSMMKKTPNWMAAAGGMKPSAPQMVSMSQKPGGMPDYYRGLTSQPQPASAAQGAGALPQPAPNGEVWGPPTGPKRATYPQEVAGAASQQPMYAAAPASSKPPASSWQAFVDSMSNPTQYTLEEEMGRGISPESLPEKAVRGALSNSSYEQLLAAAQAAGVPTPERLLSPEQIAQLEAQTAAKVAGADATVAQARTNAADIAAQYAPRTEALRQDTAQLANRNDRAESALRGELGPRVPIDPSGPYARDSRGNFRDGRVNSTYSISGAQAERDAETLASMKADDDAYRARVEVRDQEMRDRAPTEDNPYSKPITDPQQLKRDAQQFSADYQIYKRGGGALSTRDYIKQRAVTESLSKDLVKQLEHNYKMDLSPGKLQGVKVEDISSQRDVAMGNARDKREAEDARRVGARETINAAAARRGEIDKIVAADQGAGYYNTRPMREAQRAQQENMQRAMEFENNRQRTAIEGEKDVVRAKAEAEAAAFQRQLDLQSADKQQARVDEFNKAYAEGISTGAFQTQAQKDQYRQELWNVYFGNQGSMPGQPISPPATANPSDGGAQSPAAPPSNGGTQSPKAPLPQASKDKIAQLGPIEGLGGATKLADALDKGATPEQIREAAQYGGLDVSPEAVRKMHKQLSDEADEYADKQSRAEGTGVIGKEGPQERFGKHKRQFMRDKGRLIEMLLTLDPTLTDPTFGTPPTWRNTPQEDLKKEFPQVIPNDTLDRNAKDWMGW